MPLVLEVLYSILLGIKRLLKENSYKEKKKPTRCTSGEDEVIVVYNS